MNTLNSNQKIKQIGKYLYNNLDTAYNYKSGSNEFDVYFTVYYQKIHPKLGIAINSIQEMNININITTYQNKIRVNIFEVTPWERTLGYKLYPPEKVKDLPSAMKLIWNDVTKKIEKIYSEYDFIF